MPENMIRCTNCNFETPEPRHGKVHECAGECYTTYTLVRPGDDMPRVKMRLCEIFFVDEPTLMPPPHELGDHIEFKHVPIGDNGDSVLFAREYRVPEDEIEKLKNAALDRFRRHLREDADNGKLLNDILVVEKLVGMIHEKLELID